jgi:hypothetical protein
MTLCPSLPACLPVLSPPPPQGALKDMADLIVFVPHQDTADALKAMGFRTFTHSTFGANINMPKEQYEG